MPTVEELKAHAKKLGLSGYSKLKKAELEKLVKSSARAVSAPSRKSPSRPVGGDLFKGKRVPIYSLPNYAGRAVSAPSRKSPSRPVGGDLFKGKRVPIYSLPNYAGRAVSAHRPAPPTENSPAKQEFIKRSIDAGVSKTQAEYNWLMSESDDDDDLISFDFRRRRF